MAFTTSLVKHNALNYDYSCYFCGSIDNVRRRYFEDDDSIVTVYVCELCILNNNLETLCQLPRRSELNITTRQTS